MSELSVKNYRRICVINWFLAPPLFLIFAWPYRISSQILEVHALYSIPGTLLFALPFTLTLLHGHVAMALGHLHMHHFYDWLRNKPLTYGIFYHDILVSTRFRLILLVLSFAIFAGGLV
ncbi:MAG: hypothetical protein WD355_00905 [Balneolaceae bacterium]